MQASLSSTFLEPNHTVQTAFYANLGLLGHTASPTCLRPSGRYLETFERSIKALRHLPHTLRGLDRARIACSGAQQLMGELQGGQHCDSVQASHAPAITDGAHLLVDHSYGIEQPSLVFRSDG